MKIGHFGQCSVSADPKIAASVKPYLIPNLAYRFGDQILQIDGSTVAGWKLSKVHDHLRKKTDPKNIRLVIRDRPFDRTITMQKDSAGRIGFVIKVRKRKRRKSKRGWKCEGEGEENYTMKRGGCLY